MTCSVPSTSRAVPYAFRLHPSRVTIGSPTWALAMSSRIHTLSRTHSHTQALHSVYLLVCAHPTINLPTLSPGEAPASAPHAPHPLRVSRSTTKEFHLFTHFHARTRSHVYAHPGTQSRHFVLTLPRSSLSASSATFPPLASRQSPLSVLPSFSSTLTRLLSRSAVIAFVDLSVRASLHACIASCATPRDCPHTHSGVRDCLRSYQRPYSQPRMRTQQRSSPTTSTPACLLRHHTACSRAHSSADFTPGTTQR